MKFIDTHCHLNNEQFNDELDDVISRACANDVQGMVCVGWDVDSSTNAVILSRRSGVFAVIGIHPESAEEWSTSVASDLRELFSDSTAHIIGCGEMGLDYHWETVPRKRQQKVFAEQLEFAASIRADLAVVIHSRDAQADTLAILKESKYGGPILWHCFGEDLESANAILDAGCWIGIGGVFTYKKTQYVRDAIKTVGLSRAVLETDCPYLAPQKWRGKRNEPAYLRNVAETAAEVTGLSLGNVADITTANASAIYGIEF